MRLGLGLGFGESWARVGLERVRNGPSVGGSFAAILVKYGGHVVFDYSIPLCFILYLAAASRMEPRGAKAKTA